MIAPERAAANAPAVGPAVAAALPILEPGESRTTRIEITAEVI